MKAILSSLLIIFYLNVGAQNFHLNVAVGATNYSGDLQVKRYTFNQSHIGFALGLSYELSEKFFIRSQFMVGKLSGHDKFNPKTEMRNLNFTSSLTEIHLAGEYYFWDLNESSLSPYVFAGIAGYRFNPHTKDTAGTKYFLQPLSTEGQGFFEDRKPYSLTQFAVPFGGGIKYAISENLKLGAEVGMRKLFTDYLDDVSTTYVDPNLLVTNRGAKALELAFRGGEISSTETYPVAFTKRGEPKNKDWYYFTSITLSYRLPARGEINDSRGSGKKSSKLGCPRF